MSLVGTRPPTVDEWEQYELHHRSRMSTKPGITGIPDNVVMHGLKQRDGKFIVRIFGVNDNPKENRLFGMDLEQIEKDLDVKLWPDDSHTLWSAALYPEADTIEEAVSAALNLYAIVHGEEQADLSACETKIDFDLQELLKDMFIENRETEYLKGKFSILLESCSLETDKEEVLRYLAEKFEDFVEDSINIESEECNEHQLLAHFWGHLGRLFSQKGALNNFTKAEDCCKKALNYSEKTGSYDYIILHIAGDSISKRIQMILDNIYEYSDLQKNIEVIKEGISEAQEYFNKSAAYGNQQYGYNDKYDYYMVSLKQLVLGESSMVEHGDLYNALKNIKIE